MAIDTAAKRRSVAHIGRFYGGAGVTMDATPDQAWRQAVGRSYIGILSGEPSEPEAQVPAAARYRGGHRVGWVIRAVLLWLAGGYA